MGKGASQSADVSKPAKGKYDRKSRQRKVLTCGVRGLIGVQAEALQVWVLLAELPAALSGTEVLPESKLPARGRGRK